MKQKTAVKHHAVSTASGSCTSQADTGNSNRPTRRTKEKAYQDAPWKGAAPTGTRKRAGSTTEELPSKRSKQVTQPTVTLTTQPASNKKVPVPRPLRHPPAKIIDDSDSGDSDSEDDELEGSDGSQDLEEEGHDDDVEAPSDDDSQGLDNASLRQKMASEQPQWSDTSQKNNESDNIFHEESNMRSAATSEFDEEFGQSEQTGFEDDADDANDEDLDNRKGNRKHAPTRRDVARRSEVPQWKLSNRDSAAISSKGSRYRNNKSLKQHKELDVNEGWPERAHYMPVAPGSRNISLKAQPKHMKLVLKSAILHVTGTTLFDTAFPPSDSQEFREHYRDALMKCAKYLENKELFERFKQDDDIVVASARVLNARVTSIRTQAKAVTDKKVEGFFQLIPGEATMERVKLLVGKLNYIYPLTSAGNPNTKQPFMNPAIISSIKNFFFTSSRRGSLAEKYSSHFSSTIKDGPGKDDLELPIPMVCLIATTLHASLEDWGIEGFRDNKGDFRADAYVNVYQGHELFLTTLRDKKPTQYHEIMSGLYNSIVSKGKHSAAHIASTAMARLDLPVED